MSLRRSLAWAYSAQFATIPVTFIGTIIVARLLTPHEMGIFAIAMAASGVIAIFAQFGVGSYVVRESALDARTMNTAFTLNAVLNILLSLLLVATSFFGSALFDEPAVGHVLLLLAVVPLFGIFGFRSSAMFQREMRYRLISTIGMSVGLTGTAVTVAAAWMGQSYMSPAYGALATAMFGAVASAWIGKEHWGLRLSVAGWRPMLVFGLRIVSIGGVSQLTGRMCEIILGKSQGLSALGYYGRASGISNMIWNSLYGSATQVMFSQLSKQIRETGEVREIFVRSIQMITGVFWPLLIGLAVLSQPFVVIVYGEKWLPAALPLSLLMLMQAFSLAYGMNWELFVLRDELSKQTKLEVFRSVIGFTTFAIGAQFSLVGAAVGRALDAFIGIWLYVPHVRRMAGTQPGELRRVFLESGFLTLVTVGPSAALMMATPVPQHCPAWEIAVAVLTGGAMWLGGLAFINHPLLTELKVMYGALRRRPIVV